MPHGCCNSGFLRRENFSSTAPTKKLKPDYMKNLVIFAIFLALAFGLSFLFRGRMRERAASQPPAGQAYLGLRNQALQGSRAQFGLAPTAATTEPWGAVMDWGPASGTATVVALSDGHASVYIGSGFLSCSNVFRWFFRHPDSPKSLK
jgi:hypothetical protein